MKSFLAWFGFALVLVVTAGCEGSYYPMSDPLDSTVDEDMTGTWVMESPDGEERSYLNVIPFNEHEYYVEGWDEGDEDDMIRMGVFSTRLGGIWYANVRCLGCDADDGLYFFFKYNRASNDRLEITGIHDEHFEAIRKLGSIRQVRDYVAEHMNDADFFDDDMGRYEKLDEWTWPWETVR